MSPDTTDIPSLPAHDVPAPSTPGAILAAQREQSGMSVADVANKLKLSKRQIEALEADDYTVLPGNTFVRGFVRNYARLLSLDPQPLLQFLDGHLPKETAQAVLPRLRDEALPVLRPAGQGNRPGFLAAVFIGLCIASLIGSGVFWFLTQRGGFNAELMLAQPEPANAIVEMPAPVPAAAEAEQAVPAGAETIVPVSEPTSTGSVPAGTPSAELITQTANAAVPVSATSPSPTQTKPVMSPVVPVVAAPVTTPPSISAAKPAPELAPAAVSASNNSGSQSGDVRVVAKQDSWVQIVDSTGKRLVNELLPAGAVRAVSGTAPYKVRIGNGHNTTLYYKGKATDLTPHIKVDVANLELN